MNKKIIVVYLIMLLGVSCYFVFIMYKRNQNSIEQNENKNNKTEVIKNNKLDIHEGELKNDDDIEKEKNTHKPPLYEITQNNCNNECQDIKNVQKKKYCLEICGFSKDESDDCSVLIDIKKDYCLRDEAIKKHDIAICDKIVDEGVVKQCKNRISEDIIDNIMK